MGLLGVITTSLYQIVSKKKMIFFSKVSILIHLRLNLPKVDRRKTKTIRNKLPAAALLPGPSIRHHSNLDTAIF
jgi:hypothetical protein